MTYGSRVRGWLALKEALQASSLPTLVEIHLWSSLPDAFHREIERSYVLIQQGIGDLDLTILARRTVGK